MKRLFLVAALSLCASAFCAAQPDTLRVLAIGNSFSTDAVEQNLHEIAAGAGDCVVIGNMYIGGCPLERHWNNYESDAPAYLYCKIGAAGDKVYKEHFKLSSALADEKWDVVTLQQSSPLSGDFSTYEPWLGSLVESIRAALPGARLMFHQTWAYSVGSCHGGFATYSNSRDKMYAAIMDASSQACLKYSLDVIPSGTAIQNARLSSNDVNVTRDGFHLNHTLGRYTAACTWYAALFGKPVSGNPLRIEHMSDELCLLAQASADAAVREPFNTSDTGFKRPARNESEDLVRTDIVLPDPLVCYDGKPVRSRRVWEKKRAPELLEAFASQEYGRMPSEVKHFEPEVVEVKPDALDGLATRKRVLVWLDAAHTVRLDLLVYTPNGVEKAPVFLGINFMGNESITSEDDIYVPSLDERQGLYGCSEREGRGASQRRWPLKEILGRGYGVATFYRGDAYPDFWHTGEKGVQRLYPEAGRGPEGWGAISVWAWSLSRAMDYLVTDPDVDGSRVAVIGHSRLGKTALWAGACDKRFAMVVANESGCSGAKISRRNFGETVHIINWKFPYWFCDNYRKYCSDVDSLPFDQHELIALIAPRPVCIGSADQDFNADPAGEQLGFAAARPVYDLYGAADRMQYHVRPGKHDILLHDWSFYLDHADKYLK